MRTTPWHRRAWVAAPPVALTLFGLLALGESFGLWHSNLLPLGWRFMLVLVVLAAYTAGVALLYLQNMARLDEASHDLAMTEKRADFLQGHHKDLQGQIELLAAMREVTRVVTNDVEFERILEQVLRIVEGLFETKSITIYLEDPTSGDLSPQAQRKAGAAYFGERIESADLDVSHAHQVFQTQTMVRCTDHDDLHLFLPLRADRECLGVLELILTLEGTPDARAEMAEQLDHQARDLAEHIAVAIKTSHLHDKTIIDGLTKLYSKRHLMEQLGANLNLSRRHGRPFSLVMVDIDHFKAVNDTYGHLAGDLVLVGVARMLKHICRRYDMAFRYGGEELALVLPGADAEGAAKLAERLRVRLETTAFHTEDGRALRVTASFGVAMYKPETNSPEAMITAADQALYEAKESGRNRVCVAGT